MTVTKYGVWREVGKVQRNIECINASSKDRSQRNDSAFDSRFSLTRDNRC